VKELHASDRHGLLELLRKEKGRSRWLCFCHGCKRVRTVPIARLRDGATACSRCTDDQARFARGQQEPSHAR
jgi:hypothetical protein